MNQAINIIFDGPPRPESGRFVEVETDEGKGLNVGEWIDKGDGLWALRIAPDLPPFHLPAQAELENELVRQNRKWGEQNHHPERWMNILMEEVGEASQAVLKNWPLNYREEMVHVAAVAIQAIKSFDRDPNPSLRTTENSPEPTGGE